MASRGTVGVNGSQRSVVAGIHGLEHIQSFFTANLTDDDAIWPHTQAIDDQLALVHCAPALDVRRPAFQTDDVLLFHLQFG